MVQLNESMMERYEIAARRPESLRAVLIGAHTHLLGCAARALEEKNIGAKCVGAGADRLRAQDGMFTCLIRTGGRRQERVIQSIVSATDDKSEMARIAQDVRMDQYIMAADAGDEDYVVLCAMLKARFEAGHAAPKLYLLSERAGDLRTDGLRAVLAAAVGAAEWIEDMGIIRVLTDHLCGALNAQETAIEQRAMNYRDDFLMWAEERLMLTADCENKLFPAADFEAACEKKKRIFDAAAFLIAPMGYLCGMHSYAEAMADEQLRAFAAHAFYDELLPALPWMKEQIADDVICAFDRLSEPMNAVPLTTGVGYLLSGANGGILPAMRAYARQEYDVQPRLAMALSVAIMLYCGARMEQDGLYRVLRGEDRDVLRDDPAFLAAFSQMSHDMPAESIAYAVLADRGLWGCDLREIDGLEQRLTTDISAIQRIGVRETVRALL